MDGEASTQDCEELYLCAETGSQDERGLAELSEDVKANGTPSREVKKTDGRSAGVGKERRKKRRLKNEPQSIVGA